MILRRRCGGVDIASMIGRHCRRYCYGSSSAIPNQKAINHQTIVIPMVSNKPSDHHQQQYVDHSNNRCQPTFLLGDLQQQQQLKQPVHASLSSFHTALYQHQSQLEKQRIHNSYRYPTRRTSSASESTATATSIFNKQTIFSSGTISTNHLLTMMKYQQPQQHQQHYFSTSTFYSSPMMKSHQQIERGINSAFPKRVQQQQKQQKLLLHTTAATVATFTNATTAVGTTSMLMKSSTSLLYQPPSKYQKQQIRTFANRRHKRIMKYTKGYRGRSKNCFSIAVRRLHKAWQYAYRDRKTKKRIWRTVWIQRIQAGVRQYNVRYSRFIRSLTYCNIYLNRKVLSELAATEPFTFKAIIDVTYHQQQMYNMEQQKKKIGATDNDDHHPEEPPLENAA